MSKLNFKLNQVKAAIFDFDGTLADSIPIWKQHIDPKVYQTFGLDFNKTYDQYYSQVMGMSIKGRAKLFVTMHELQSVTTGEEVFNLYAKIYNEVFDSVVKVFDGVVDLLEFFKEKGIKCAIATGCDISLMDIALAKLDLAKYMTAVVTCDDVGEHKPNPLVYMAAMEKCGATKEESIIFEDSVVGIKDAKNAQCLQHLLYLSDNNRLEEKKSYTDYHFTDYKQFLADLKATSQ